MTLTILTPTYNRANMLPNLYNSLLTQTSRDFEWLIVDDGSTDDTETIVQQWIADNAMAVRYLYKKNGGKHTALNAGISTVTSQLTMIVDSDDALTPDAVETVLQYHGRYKDVTGLCGYVFLRCFPDGTVNGKQFIPDEAIGTYIDMRINRDDTHADKAEVYFTHCLQEYPFPEIGEEKFLGEDLVWIRMAKKYCMLHVNRVIYIGNYLEGGLTQSRRRHNIESPRGCMLRAIEFMSGEIRFKYRFKGALQYLIYGQFAHIGWKSLIRQSPRKLLTALLVVPGFCLYRKWKHNYECQKNGRR